MELTDMEKLWNNVLIIIKEKLPPQSYNSWFSNTKITGSTNNRLMISVPSTFCKDWLEKHYLDLIQDVLQKRLGLNKNLSIQFKVVGQKSSGPILKSTTKNTKNTRTTPIYKKNIHATINPKYTFIDFVVGNSNRFSHAASLAVAKSPGKAYNPLFLYGGVGLGKTHLLQAIGNYIIKQDGIKKIHVLYISSEKFTNELINSIRDDRTVNFRNKYRHVDVLLIDDIQFLAGKERTQEEFFHTFNTLYESNKQIVITSDKPPKDIPTLEKRLISRFEWGLITDITPPDFETRVAILRKKTEKDKLKIPNNIIDFVADNIPANIRKLEGALIKLNAYSKITGREISLPLAQEVLKDIIPLEKKDISIKLIQKLASEYYGIKINDLLSIKRTKNIVLARQIAIYLSRELTEHSLNEIGEAFKGKDHTTIMHSYSKIKNNIKSDKNLKMGIANLISKIKNV
ncbi:MAG: chromosomal replication initiator protein DnaA [Candidatus Caldatribacteriota bacterium]|nr:chromosomal replication initiator protein DnaA [Candidatus Caldatribacteriota bacterium]